MLCTIHGISAQERHGAPGAGPEEGDKDYVGIGESLVWGKAEGAGPLQPQEEATEAQNPSMSTWRVGVKRSEPGCGAKQ